MTFLGAFELAPLYSFVFSPKHLECPFWAFLLLAVEAYQILMQRLFVKYYPSCPTYQEHL